MGLNLLIVKCFGIVMSATGSYQMFLECIRACLLNKTVEVYIMLY